MRETTEKAKAKINLFLEVFGKRADSYHEIESVMASIDLSDELNIVLTDDGISVILDASSCERPADAGELSEKDNLAYKAALSFFEALDEKEIPHGGALIKIKKVIPVRSGLAGGSTDAAAVLRGLNALNDFPFDEDGLCSIASHLGADVPFCVISRLAVCRGVGDEMTVIDSDVELHGVLSVEKTEKLSTKTAYAAVDKYNETGKNTLESSDELVRALELGDKETLRKELYNVFDAACGYGNTVSEIMKECGADNVTLSGAGPAYFTLTDDEKLAEKIAEALCDAGYPAYIF